MKKLLSLLFLCCAVLLYTNTVNAQCAIDIALTSVICDDNGTADFTDDVYTLEVTVNYANAVGTTYTVTNGPGGPVIATGTYNTPPTGTDVLTFMLPADGSSLDLTVLDDGDNTCTFSTGFLGDLLPCSGGGTAVCLVSSGSSVTSPVCAGAVEGIFTVTISNCFFEPGTAQNAFLLFYDLDVTNAPPTSTDLYNDATGAIDAPDLANFGEIDLNCSGVDFVDLEGFENPSCVALELDLYLMPFQFDPATGGGTIDSNCAIEGPIRLVTEPATPTYITDCAAGELIAGFDNGDGAGGAPDGDFDDPEDLICSSIPIDFSGCPASAGSAQFTAADLGGLFGNDGSCYADSGVFTCPCACNTVAPSVTITGEDCADGTMGAPYIVGEDGTGFLDAGNILEYIIYDDAAGTATSIPGAILSVGDAANAQAAVDAAAEGSEVCVGAIAHSPNQLAVLFDVLDGCLGGTGFLYTQLGITPPVLSLETAFQGLLNFNNGANPGFTLADVEVLLGGANGGPGTGATIDLGDLLGLGPGVIFCDVPAFCYNSLPETCVTINAECPVVANPMATISDPCNCANGIDLDGDGINDLALEVITITDPGGGQGWALSSNDGGLIGIDGVNPTTSPIVDNGDGTYTQTGYVLADGATTYSVEFTATDGEVLTISGGPCAACPAPLEEVPTVGEWGLIILGLLMSIAAIVGIRQRRLEENIA